ncbi:MAG: tRNA lysidine(34) synthetase TilS, partial [Deltaproteobacteria bacterium]|nr:tRNA lysidine(34) synthetase TilS [Deltaproteobacteria bacterium]
MPAKSKIFETVKNTILKYNMIRPGDRIIAAVSGGPDSICLVDLLAGLSKTMDITLVAAHYEHGLRPEEDTFETDLVKETASSLNIPFETEKASGLTPLSSSLEEKARELRYDFLERTRIKYNAHKIAMGHNLNDQAETVLMRLLRGSGMTGLSGIPPVRDNKIIRPLIETGREDIIDYLEARGLEYATDSSNR